MHPALRRSVDRALPWMLTTPPLARLIRRAFCLVLGLSIAWTPVEGLASDATSDDGLFPPGFELPESLAAMFADAAEARGRDLRWFVLPGAGYTPETSFLFSLGGLVQWRLPGARAPGTPASLFTVFGTYTLNRQWLLNTSVAFVTHDDQNRWDLELGGGSWQREYFGVGPTSPSTYFERFDRRFIEAEAEWAHALVRQRLYAGVSTRLDAARIGPIEAGRLELDAPLGVKGGLTLGVGTFAYWDSRDEGAFPYQGFYARMDVVGHPARWGDYGFTSGRLDVRAYTSRRAHVWANRVAVDLQSPGAPFYLLQDIGGGRALRGITEGRYLANNRFLAVSEYRTPFAYRLGGVAFAGMGDVFSSLGALSSSRPKWSAGLGMRLRVLDESRMNLRFDYGMTRDDRGFYVSLGESF